MADECGLSLLFAWSLAAQGMAAQQMFGVAGSGLVGLQLRPWATERTG